MKTLKLFILMLGLMVGSNPALADTAVSTRPGIWIRAATTGAEADLELRSTDGRNLVPSLRNDLLNRIAADQMDEVTTQTIMTELVALTDSIYIFPTSMAELGAALGVPVDGLDATLPEDPEQFTPEMANIQAEKFELMSVHVQLVLQVQAKTANYLLGIITKSSRN